jgi:hypothetical protein
MNPRPIHVKALRECVLFLEYLEFQEFLRGLRMFQEFLENIRNIKEFIADKHEFSGIFKNISGVLGSFWIFWNFKETLEIKYSRSFF